MSGSETKSVSFSKDDEVGIIEINNPPVNALSSHVRRGIVDAIVAANHDDDVKAILLIAKGRMFSAGADIKEFGKAPIQPSLREVIKAISSSPKKVISVVHGVALGGGFELTLGCHYRLAGAKARFGLPEVNIGILPGAGGTQRLPRIIGIEPALDVIVSAKQFDADKAFKLGIIDKILGESLFKDAKAFAHEVIEGNIDAPIATNGSLEHLRKDAAAVFAKFRSERSRRFRGVLAPEYAIRAVEAAIYKDFDAGMTEERSLLDSLRETEQPAALQHVFFSERTAAKLSEKYSDATPREVKAIGVIGAGTMGGGIAMNFLNIGMPVTILDRSSDALERGLGVIRKNYGVSAKRGKITTAQIEERMAMITTSTNVEDLSGCDLIIEAIFEQIDIKQSMFRELDRVAKDGAILATNTSYLDIDEIAKVTNRPQDIVGMHFFSPANVMRLLEVVKTNDTAPDVIATAMAIGKKIGKVSVLVGNGYGFVGNRILKARGREANQLVLEGASPMDVDRVYKAFGFAMGHFAMRDLVGLDVGWNPDDTHSRDVREILNEMGRHGQKTGGGFYDYEDGRTPIESEVSLKVIKDFAKAQGIIRRKITDEEILERSFYTMVNEGAKILEEGIAVRASDIDVVWVTGYGWPKYKGGPIYWGARNGIPALKNMLDNLAKTHGDHFKPAKLIVELAKTHSNFA